MKPITFLLSPEQIQDAQGAAWLREATTEESEAFKEAHPILPVDCNFRPYFPVVADLDHPDMPAPVKAQLGRALRIFRFWEVIP